MERAAVAITLSEAERRELKAVGEAKPLDRVPGGGHQRDQRLRLQIEHRLHLRWPRLFGQPGG